MTLLSRVAESNLFTMGAASLVDPRQAVPDHYTNRSADTRLLRARLILEEALETIAALGIDVRVRHAELEEGRVDNYAVIKKIGENVDLVVARDPDLEGIIDGCCDTIYVAVGCMLMHGAPDLPHLVEVCNRNDAKFPGGVALVDGHGKYTKPEGWYPPNHKCVMGFVEEGSLDLPARTKMIMEGSGWKGRQQNASA